MIEVKQILDKKTYKDFIKFPLALYKDSKYYVPELQSDLKDYFKENCIYLDQCDQAFFLAYKDGVVVGRIHAIIQKAANEKWNQKRVRFTRFDSIDDVEVSNALFKAAEDWGKKNGMEEIVGPLGYNDFEREGLLIEGFDQPQTFEEQYNYEYYVKLVESYGFKKEVDWTESRLYAPDVVTDHTERLANFALKRYNLHLGKAKNTSEFLKKYGDAFFEIVDDTYKDIYGTCPFSEKIKEKTLKSFRLILNMNDVAVILDENEHVVCFGLCFPSIADAVRKCKGKFTPLGLMRLLHAIKHPKVIDLGLVGVREEYRGKAVNAIILHEIMKILTKGNVEYAETNLNLENNTSVTSQWKEFKEVRCKRRRSYIKKI